MVELGEERPPPIGQPLNDVNLPKRPGPVHLAADDAGNLLGQLIGGAWWCDSHVAHVEVEVEIGIVDPVGVVEAERDLGEPPAKRFGPSDHRLEASVNLVIGIIGR